MIEAERKPTIAKQQEAITPIGAKIGEHEYFTAQQLCATLEVPLWYLLDACRRGCFGGRKLGRVYLIDGESFREWVASGRCDYTPRTRVNGDK